MEKSIKIYDLHDPAQEQDNIEYWKGKSAREKLHTLETIRASWNKFSDKNYGEKQRLRRVIRVTESS